MAIETNQIASKHKLHKLIFSGCIPNGYDPIFSYKTESKIIIMTKPIAKPIVPKFEWSPD